MMNKHVKRKKKEKKEKKKKGEFVNVHILMF